MIWEPGFECLEREELRRLQFERLQKVVDRVYHQVPFYRRKFEETGIKPEAIRSLEDLEKLPFTQKDDLRDNYPYGMFAVPLKEIVRIHSSSGTTGIPTVVGYTKKDLETWSNLVARFITAAGVTSEDIVQISFGYGLFTGGFGLALRDGAGWSNRHSGLQRQYGAPDQNHEGFRNHGAGGHSLVRLVYGRSCQGNGLWTGYPQTQSRPFWGGTMVGEYAEGDSPSPGGSLATDNYGLSEVIGPGVSGECTFCSGLHIFEDHFIPEIIDPVTGDLERSRRGRGTRFNRFNQRSSPDYSLSNQGYYGARL